MHYFRHFLLLGFYILILNSCPSCLVWSGSILAIRISYKSCIYVILSCVAFRLRLSEALFSVLGSAWGVPVRFPFGRSCLQDGLPPS